VGCRCEGVIRWEWEVGEREEVMVEEDDAIDILLRIVIVMLSC